MFKSLGTIILFLGFYRGAELRKEWHYCEMLPKEENLKLDLGFKIRPNTVYKDTEMLTNLAYSRFRNALNKMPLVHFI